MQFVPGRGLDKNIIARNVDNLARIVNEMSKRLSNISINVTNITSDNQYLVDQVILDSGELVTIDGNEPVLIDNR